MSDETSNLYNLADVCQIFLLLKYSKLCLILRRYMFKWALCFQVRQTDRAQTGTLENSDKFAQSQRPFLPKLTKCWINYSKASELCFHIITASDNCVLSNSISSIFVFVSEIL